MRGSRLLRGGSIPPPLRYIAGAVLLLVAYAVLAPLAWAGRGFTEEGPLSLRAPALTSPVEGGVPLDRVRGTCLGSSGFDAGPSYPLKVVGGPVLARSYYACYQLKPDGSVRGSRVLAADGTDVDDVQVLKRGGAWRWAGTVKTSSELVLAGFGIAAVLLVDGLYWKRPRPARPAREPWWRSRPVELILGCVPLLGWLLLLWLPGRSPARRVLLAYQVFFGWSGFFLLVVVLAVVGKPDAVGWVAVGGLLAAFGYGWLGGRLLLAPTAKRTRRAGPPRAAQGPVGPEESSPRLTVDDPAPGPAPGAPRRLAGARVRSPAELPTFADVGGMAGLKTELSDTFGLLLAFGEQAQDYRISFNGILLHGAPGVGKTFLARAVAGEFGLSFLGVSVGDLASKFSGETAQNIAAAFTTAVASVPCVLFFDEFDAIAADREDEPDQENRRTVDQLLTSLERYREVAGLVVMAATNRLEQLDPAVVRPGRFDRQVLVPLPDEAARAAVLHAQLAGRPVGIVDVDRLAARTEGLTPASLAAVVESAALAAFRETTATGTTVPLTTAHLLGALAARGGKDRPTVEHWNWDAIVLDPAVQAELQQVQALVEDPEQARAYGIKPPSGLLLTGPPGTGKTTIARVLAAEARTSFYAVTAADLLSKWVGESESNVARLFARARENAPSIVFLDEIDAVAGRRGELAGGSSQTGLLNTLLAEMDGLEEAGGVFVIGATNRPQDLDPALVRGGRLSRTLEVPLPAAPARERLLALFTASMPLRDVSLPDVAADTDGFSGADLEALCQQAAVVAMTRTAGAGSQPGSRTVTTTDFRRAVGTLRAAQEHDRPEPGRTGPLTPTSTGPE